MEMTRNRWIGVGAGVGTALAGVVVARWIASRRRRRASLAEAVTIRRTPTEVAHMWSQLAPLERWGEAAEVSFTAAPGARGTEVRVDVVGQGALRAFEVRQQLRRFKQCVETGDVVEAAP